jgi:hypothetical protein
MLQILGAVGLGLVWGWLAVRLCQGAGWAKIVRVVLWIVVQALLIAWFGTTQSLIAFGVALLFSALFGRAWIRLLALRFGQQ